MERTEKPWEGEGEEKEGDEIREEEEEINGGLEVRERRRGKMGVGIVIRENNEGYLKKVEKVEEKTSVYLDSEKEEKVEEENKVEEERNVYFDSAKDSNLQNGTNGTNISEILTSSEMALTPKVVQFENGSSSISKPYSQLFTTSGNGSTSDTIVNIKELDLEKVLEEQETHDLYCPNCNSCITRRVILKKRKRIAKDVKPELRPEKIPNLGPIETVSENLDESEEPNILFRCLSCFTFFIPRDCGFDIFHIFGGNKERIQTPAFTHSKEEIQNMITTRTKEEIKTTITAETKEEIQITVNNQASNQHSEANNYNWFLGLFQPGGNQKKPAHPVTEEQKSDIIASSTASAVTSASKITEIQEIETADIKIDTAKMPDLSYIVTKQEDQIEVINTVNVNTEILLKGPVLVTPTVPRETIIDMPKIRPRECGCPGVNINNWNILKPIIYGGLAESITSLSVVSSAASTGASTLNILLLGAANLIGGLLLIIHDLSELKHAQDEADDRNEDELGRYWALLGRKGSFGLHATIAIISYIFFGLLPPLVYGFSFQKTNNSEYKMIAVAATSLVCIAMLSIGKAHVRPRRTYFTTMLYYVIIGFSASGLSYVAGMLLKQLIESLGLFDQGSSPVPSPPSLIDDIKFGVPSWASF